MWRLAVPVTAVLGLPETIDDTAGALVEPGGNALRAVRAANLSVGEQVLVMGPGTIGLLAAHAVANGDVTAVGILSASPGLAGAIDYFGSGEVDPRPLVATTVGLDQVGAVLAGWLPDDAGPGPKVHVDPRR